jgi:hypothetical protein
MISLVKPLKTSNKHIDLFSEFDIITIYQEASVEGKQ